MKRMLFAATAILSLAACTPAQEQEVLNSIQNDCLGAVVGSTIVVSIASSLIPGGAPVAVLANTVGSNPTGLCTGILASAQAVVEGITAAGGTATVTVAQAPTRAAALKVLHRLSFKRSGGSVRMTDLATQKTYTVSPDLMP